VAKDLIVRILGDPSELSASLKEATAETEGFGSKMGAGLKAAGLVAGAGIAVAAIAAVEFTKEAMKAQAQTAALDQALNNAGIPVKSFGSSLDEAEKAGRQMGFSNIEVREGLTKLVTATGDGKKAVTDLAVAEDLARFKHTTLAAASDTLTRAISGNSRALKSLGIDVPAVTAHMDALRLSHMKTGTAAYFHAEATAKAADKADTASLRMQVLSDKIHGQAQAYSETAAGGMARFHAAIENLSETLGAALLPAVALVTNKLADFVNWLMTSGTAQKIMADAVTVVKTAIADLQAAFTAIMPVATAVFSALETAFGFLQDHQTAVEVVAGALGGMAVALGTVAVALGIASAATTVWTGAMVALDAVMAANPIVLLGIAIAALVGGLVVAYEKSQTFRDIVNQAWSDIKSVVIATVATIKSVITTFIAEAERLWREFGSNILSVVQNAWKLVKAEFDTAVRLIGDAITLIGDLIHGRWSKIWGDVKALVGDAISGAIAIIKAAAGLFLSAAELVGKAIWDGIKAGVAGIADGLAAILSKIGGVLSSIASLALGWAAGIGSAIVSGIVSGLSSLAGSLASSLIDPIKNAFNAAKHFLKVGSPSQLAADELGKPISEGIEQGYLLGSGSLPTTISKSLAAALQAGKQAIDAARSSFTTAFGDLANTADQAFDAIYGSVQTKSERILSIMQSQDTWNQLVKNLNDAKAAIGADKGDLGQANVAVDDAQKALATAKNDPNTSAADLQTLSDNLNKALAAQQQAHDKMKADTAAFHDAQRAITEQKLTENAAVERKKLDEQTAAKKAAFDKQLAALEASLTKEGASQQKAHAAIMALFKKFGVDYQASGAALGQAFADGLASKETAVSKSAKKLAQKAADALQLHSPAKEGPLSTLDTWWTPFADTLLSGFGNGAEKVGAFIQAAVTPGSYAGSGAALAGGGVSVHINSPTFLSGDDNAARQLAELVQAHLTRIAAVNGGVSTLFTKR
jgi:phage-related protein